MSSFKRLLETKRNLEQDKFYALIRNASTLVSKEREIRELRQLNAQLEEKQ